MFETLWPFWQVKRAGSGYERVIFNLGALAVFLYVVFYFFASPVGPSRSSAARMGQFTLTAPVQMAAPIGTFQPPAVALQIPPTEVPTYDPPPTAFPTTDPKRFTVRGLYSWYWPPYGGINCGHGPNDDPLSGVCDPYGTMASGDRWLDYIGKAVACAVDWPLHSRVIFLGREWICLDRGGAIVAQGGAYWFDFLQPYPDEGLAFGSEIELEVIVP